ncbi:MAG: hypothetical protein C4536_01140 [Actinobacteria bacterium]|jgi:uncharacterized membrane protein|nr:MAG: hypothetical protein C4536_01140 [Actinomycetota bacterium]
MGQKVFTIAEPWRFVLDNAKRNLVYLLMVGLILLLPLNILYYFQRAFMERRSGVYELATFVAFFLIAMVYVAFIKIGLRFAAAEQANLSDLSDALSYYWRYLLGLFLYSLIFIGGLLLLIVPGIIWAVKYQFFGYFIVDKGMKPVEALTRSGQLTMGKKGQILAFDLVFLAIEAIIVWPLWLLSKTASQIIVNRPDFPGGSIV